MVNFNLLRIPVCIQPSFLLLLCFFTGIYKEISFDNLVFCTIFVISLLVHEFGHGLAALYFGARPEINLEAFGGTTSYNDLLTDKQSFIVTLCGPLLESVLILIPYLLLEFNYFAGSYISYILYVTMKLNIFWLLFNLLPIEPLDGGKLMRYVLERCFGDNGTKVSVILGFVACVLGAPYYLLRGSYVFGGLLVLYGFKSIQTYYSGVRLTCQSPFSLYNQGMSYMQTSEVDKAKSIFKKLSKSEDDFIRISSVEALATIFYDEGEHKRAYSLLLKNEAGLKNGKCLLCKLALEEKNYPLIEKYSREIYAMEPTYEIALLNSKAFEALNNPTLAGGWQHTASLFKSS